MVSSGRDVKPSEPNAALAWYRLLREKCPRSGGYTIPLIAKSAMAAPMTFRERTAILVDLAKFQEGCVTCPFCGCDGPHHWNEHHRFDKIRFACIKCGKFFRSIQVK